MTAYYNEIDPYAAAWLRNLISAGHIALGDVDERSIEDVRPDELRGYTQCHFFAGIGVWSYALRRAGWSDDRPVWTGSCPCQPFSAAGKGGGFADERHLWPAFHHLIRECAPGVVLGEQVASKDGLAWLDLVQADLEGTAYASGAVDLCAAGVGSPHIRQRLWWVGERLDQPAGIGREGQRAQPEHGQPVQAGADVGRLEPAASDGRIERRAEPSGRGAAGGCSPVGLADDDETGQRVERIVRLQRPHLHDADGCREDGRMADAADIGRDGRRTSETSVKPGSVERSARLRAASAGPAATSPTNGIWRDADWLFCRDGKWRPVEPGTFPLAHGAASRVGRLRAYGNAIVAQAAEEFIRAYLESAVA